MQKYGAINVEDCKREVYQGCVARYRKRRTSEVVSVRKCQSFPSGLTEPMPAGSRTDSLLAKSESISNGGSAFGITLLNRGRRSERKCSWCQGKFLCSAGSLGVQGDLPEP